MLTATMERLLVRLALLGLIISASAGPSLVGASPLSATVQGVISQDTTWTLVDSPITVTGNVVVEEGVTLTIEPGVTVQFDEGKALDINGTLIAQGTSGSKITFTSSASSPAAGDWKFLRFGSSSVPASFDGGGNYVSGSILQHCTVQYAGFGSTSPGNVPAIKLDQAAPFVDHCTIRHNLDRALAGQLPSASAAARITNNTFDDNRETAVFISANSGGGTLLIADNVISDTLDYTAVGNMPDGFGIKVEGGSSSTLTATISGNTITSNAFHGISVRTGGIGTLTATISDNSSNNNGGYGLVIAEESSGAASASSFTVERNEVLGNTLGGVALGAKVDSTSPAATITVDGNVIHNNSGSGVVIGLWDSWFAGLTKPGSNQCSGSQSSLHHIIVSNNTISQNTGRGSTNDGGVQGSAIFHCFNGKTTITGNRIHDNGSSSAQSTIWFHLQSTLGEVTFQNNQVSGNQATSATLFLSYGPGLPTISTNAFHDNDAPNDFRPHQNQSNDPIVVENNWWGADSEAFAESRIFHKNDDITFTNVDFIPILAAPPVSAPPAPPTNLAAQTANTSISLAWDANAEADIAGYKLHWDTDAPGYPFANVADVGNVTAHTLTDLTQGTTYHLALSAYDSDGNKSWLSNGATGSTSSPTPTPNPTPAPTPSATPMPAASPTPTATPTPIAVPGVTGPWFVGTATTFALLLVWRLKRRQAAQ